MWRQNLIRLGTGLGLAVALLGSVACHESDGTKRIEGTYPPESEIDRNYPDEDPTEDPSSDAGSDAEPDEPDADTDSGSGTE